MAYDETTPMKQMVAGPCLSMQELGLAKKRMMNQLTGGRESSEMVVSKYFKRPESPEETVNIKNTKVNLNNSVMSESWHVKRDD